MADTTQVSQSTTDAAGHVYDSAQAKVQGKSNDPRLGHSMAARVAASTIAAPAWVTAAIGAVLSTIGKAAAVILDTYAKARKAGQPGLNALVASALSDVLQLNITEDQLAVGKGPDAARQTNTSIGKAFLDGLSASVAPGDAVGPDKAQAAAEAFIGFNMQFASSTALLGILGELMSWGNIKDVGEIGDMMEKTLGLGRLNRQALRPLIRNTIEQPYDRQMRAKYRQDLLAAAELVKASLSGRMPVDQARGFLAQHGLSDQFIDELAEQYKPRLHPEETELLVALGKAPADSASNAIYADGTPKDVIDARLAVLTWKRLNHLRTAILNEVLSQIQHGGADAALMDAAISDLGIPTDEAELWRKRVGYLQGGPRRRLSLGEMLFLFEASQITLDQVQQWAASQGYSQEDQLNLQLYFELKAAAAHSTKSGGTAAKAAHVHKEHVLFVWEQFMAAFQRVPTPAESDRYVGMLDAGDATKADVSTDIKRIAKGNLAT